MIRLDFFCCKSTLPARKYPLLVFLCISLLVAGASAYGYSEDYEGYLGETIALHGVSYNSEQVYLFMTGPGLPENGVTLTDTSKRADQGEFTTVGVDSSQQWAMKWDTSRIDDQIDPGTYTVYVVNAPVDKADLAGHSYQTLTVYLKDGSLSKNRVSVGPNYTLRPGRLTDDDTTVPTTISTPVPTSSPVTSVPETTVPPMMSTTPPQKSPVSMLTPILGVAGVVCIWCSRRRNG